MKITVHEYLVKLGYANRYDVWIPHNLTKKDLINRICDLLNKRNENALFLKLLITSDEEWIIYNNVERNRISEMNHY